MKDKSKTGEIPIVGGKTIEIGKYNYNLIVVLSDHKDPKDQELALFQYSEKALAVDMRTKILKEGIDVKTKEAGVDVELFYPPHQIRKIILRSEPITMRKPGSIRDNQGAGLK